MVEAKVAPRDIDQVATGAKAVVRIMAGNQRTQPEIKGVLTRVSADLAHEPQQHPNGIMLTVVVKGSVNPAGFQ